MANKYFPESGDYEASDNEKLDAMLVIRLSKRLKGRVIERARLKKRTVSDWTRLAYERLLNDLDEEKPTA